MTLAAAESGRRYPAADLMPTEELARRAAQAMDNARLYQEARAAVRAPSSSATASRSGRP